MLFRNLTKEVGRLGVKWDWMLDASTASVTSVDNLWVADFWFENPHDAVMFGLKYSQ